MLKELGREIITSGKHLELVRIKLEGGRVYEACTRVGNKNAVAGIVRHTENRSYILIEQYRYPVKQRVLELVAGLIDKPNLSKEQIMQEEVVEETGYSQIQSIEFIGETSGSAGKSSETTSLFDIEITGEKGNQDLSEMENIKVIEVAYGDFDKFLVSKIKEGMIIDPKVCMAIYMTLEKTKKLL
ncbi:MAG: NUDIX hydrolase [Candidatus Gracilibacteria bacterium]|nr:NUDIX hydrolase [Candidatus Gracilibacteria bacterium]